VFRPTGDPGVLLLPPPDIRMPRVQNGRRHPEQPVRVIGQIRGDGTVMTTLRQYSDRLELEQARLNEVREQI